MSKSTLIKCIISILSIVIILNIFCLPKSHAVGEIFSKGRSFLSVGNDIDKTINTTELKNTSDYIYKILFAVAVIVAVIIAMVIGIQFMAASADEKAKVKEALLPFVVGCAVVFGSFGIWKIAVNIGNDAESRVSVPQVSGLTWTKAADAKEYIDGGGDLKEVPDDKLLEWYGQLSRLSGNKGAYTEYYNKVRDVVNARGLYEE